MESYKQVLLVCLIFLIAGCETMPRGEIYFQGLHAVDVLQTLNGPARDACFKETAPVTRRLIGDKPSEGQVLARLSSHDDQRELLEEIESDHDWEVSAKEVQSWVTSDFLMRLDSAPFPIDDEGLIVKAGPCTTCPKRTAAQVHLFGDLGDDRCTDRDCFKMKKIAYSTVRIEQARADGRDVIEGEEAKKASPHGSPHFLPNHYSADASQFVGGKMRQTKAIVGKQLTPAALVLPDGEVVDVYRRKDVDAIIKEKWPDDVMPSSTGSEAELRRKRAEERKFRQAVYAEVRSKLPPASTASIAARMLEDMDFDSLKVLAEIRSWTPPEKTQYTGGPIAKDWRAITKTWKGMDEPELQQLINDLLNVRLVSVHTWQDHTTPKELKAMAKEHGVDTRALRASVKAKPKAKAKAKSQKKKKDLDPFVHNTVEAE